MRINLQNPLDNIIGGIEAEIPQTLRKQSRGIGAYGCPLCGQLRSLLRKLLSKQCIKGTSGKMRHESYYRN